ncbi:MAG: DUF4386 domain-containing protein [Cyclobacteriaceae bacterium]
METNRKVAIIVGSLFILADITLFAGEAFYKPILSSPDYLDIAYPNEVGITTGILLEFTGYLGLVLIPVLLFPVLKKHNQILALGYVSFRLFEVVLLSIAQVSKLALVSLSETYLSAGGKDVAQFQNIGHAIQSLINWVNSDGFIYITVFVIGTLMLNAVFYTSRLVPRWVSIWGLLAAVALLAATVIDTFDLASEMVAIALVIPIALQEIVMSVWLIIKGFNPAPNAVEVYRS